ncbi:Bgt-282 [Blumeria graminis f. sp. tritici]|uniref:Bgt-282 n=2 Tax=Blumeria graminis f. sp. tritici TaxID=62690 RepID=A0A061HIJ3_BLUGR|nr:Low affinity monovalent cation-H+ antiporter [Blumeria graminis f. sp. tritici 96224]VDB93805.1 Bgt-282 [Blumeria graminis f. sp. tritici]
MDVPASSSSKEITEGKARQATQSHAANMSKSTSPKDTRNAFTPTELMEETNPSHPDFVSTSFQSTDTVRRWPEPQSYGKISPIHEITYRSKLLKINPSAHIF